jgi:hypothetical protein
MKKSNTHVIGAPRERWELYRKVSEEIMTEEFRLLENINLQIQET